MLLLFFPSTPPTPGEPGASLILTLGFGNGTLVGSPSLVLTLGYGIGEGGPTFEFDTVCPLAIPLYARTELPVPLFARAELAVPLFDRTELAVPLIGCRNEV